MQTSVLACQDPEILVLIVELLYILYQTCDVLPVCEVQTRYLRVQLLVFRSEFFRIFFLEHSAEHGHHGTVYQTQTVIINASL